MNIRNKILVRTVHILFGLYLIATGLVSYFLTLPAPQYNEAAMAFLGALFATGYMFHVTNIIFVASGLMFLFNRWPAFGAVLLAPVTINIALFHIFLDSTGLALALIPVLINIYLGIVYWPQYKSLFRTPPGDTANQ